MFKIIITIDSMKMIISHKKTFFALAAGLATAAGSKHAEQMDFMGPPPRPEPPKKSDYLFTTYRVFGCDEQFLEWGVTRTRWALLGGLVGSPLLIFLTSKVPRLQYTIAGLSVISGLVFTGVFLGTRKAVVSITLHEDMERVTVERGPVTLTKITYNIKDLKMDEPNPMIPQTDITVRGKDIQGKPASFFILPIEYYQRFGGRFENMFLLHTIITGNTAEVKKFKFTGKK